MKPPALRPWLVEQGERNARRLAGAGRRDQHRAGVRRKRRRRAGSASSIGSGSADRGHNRTELRNDGSVRARIGEAVRVKARRQEAPMDQQLIAILPCNDSTPRRRSSSGWASARAGEPRLPDARDGLGGESISRSGRGLASAGRNPFGLTSTGGCRRRRARSRRSARRARGQALGNVRVRLNGPDDTLVRIGWPSAASDIKRRARGPPFISPLLTPRPPSECSVARSTRTPGPMVEETAARSR